MSEPWRKKDVDSSFLSSSSSSIIPIGSESGIVPNQSFGVLQNNAIFGLTNAVNSANNAPVNFEQFYNSPERLLKMQQFIESGIGYVYFLFAFIYFFIFFFVKM